MTWGWAAETSERCRELAPERRTRAAPPPAAERPRAGCPHAGASPHGRPRLTPRRPWAGRQGLPAERRAVDCGHVLPSERPISGRWGEAPVAEEALHGLQSHPGCEPRRGTTVAPRLAALAGGAPRQPLGVGGELLGTSAGQRLGAVWRRQEPGRGAGAVPGGPECREAPGRQPRGTVLPPFALMAAHAPTVTCEVGAVPPHDCPTAQARGRGRHAPHAMAGAGRWGTGAGVLRPAAGGAGAAGPGGGGKGRESPAPPRVVPEQPVRPQATWVQERHARRRATKQWWRYERL